MKNLKYYFCTFMFMLACLWDAVYYFLHALQFFPLQIAVLAGVFAGLLKLVGRVLGVWGGISYWWFFAGFCAFGVVLRLAHYYVYRPVKR